MKKKMRYLGWLENCMSEKKRRTWLGYDHKNKHSVLIMELDLNKHIRFFGAIWIPGTPFHFYYDFNKPDINYWHENYWYPEDLEGETVEIKLKPKEI